MQRILGRCGFSMVEVLVIVAIIGAMVVFELYCGAKMIDVDADATVSAQKAFAKMATQSPEAAFGARLYRDCLHPGLFSSHSALYCRQVVLDLATKQYGRDSALKSVQAVDTMVFLEAEGM